ncbi:unnamed protein product [Trichogramma brassicae]|uniref:Multiple inositol polyphosphate phosphatase 1 n=1 Tax=Trichogramma brassicae TaxID=86971 RepID=A0A6H5IP34_9HYME|nr:unnamed protein product [Trichogramma brassicae]
MTTRGLALLVGLLLIDGIAARESDYCYSYESYPYVSMATKTAYQFAHGKARLQPVPYGRMCDQDLQRLRNWRPNPNMIEFNADLLTEQGNEDMRLLAKRLQSYFPELLRTNSYSVSYQSFKLMYDMCRYDKAWNIAELSPWCSVFSKQELMILEYTEDLEEYYKSGPGREVNAKLGCPLLNDMFDHFKNLERGNFNNEPRGIFYFAHSTTLLNLLSSLDIRKDTTPLLSHNYHSMERRRFKTSEIDAFASNLVAVFYRCSELQPNKVMFFLNEQPVYLDGCSVGLCDWEYLKGRFGREADKCNLDFCYNVASSSFSTLQVVYSTIGLVLSMRFLGALHLLVLLLCVSVQRLHWFQTTRHGKLCSSDIEKFRLWRLDPGMTEAASDNLVPQGYIELRSIAQRLGHAFPELLHVPHYDEKEFLAHKNCPAWTASTIARKNTERDQFTQGSEMQILFREVSERLGFRINETTLGIECEPLQVWAIIRHGTRYLQDYEVPEYGIDGLEKIRDEIVENHRRGAGHLCSEDVEKIRSWRFTAHIRPHDSDDMTELGHYEMSSLGTRLKNFFPEIFDVDPEQVTPDDFQPMYEMCRWEAAWFPNETSTWCMAFTKEHLKYYEYREDLNYYYCCGPAQRLSQKLGCLTLSDMFNHFEETSAASAVQTIMYALVIFLALGPQLVQLSMIQQGTGQCYDSKDEYYPLMSTRTAYELIYGNMTRPPGTISAMQEMCRFELAWNPQNVSAWCTVFSKNDLKIFEYKDDLNNYYCCGPGRAMSTKLGCEMMSNMYRHFEDLVRSNFTGQPKGVFYFTHTVALRVLMTALKMHFMPVNMTSQNFATMQDRIFRSSLQGAFAGNVIAVFYRCSGQNKVVFYVSERVLEFPGCDRGVCDWEYLKKLYAPQVAVCNLDWCFQNETEKNIWLSGKSVPSGLGDDEPEKSTTGRPRPTEAPPVQVPFNISDYEPKKFNSGRHRPTEAPPAQVPFDMGDYESKKSTTGKPRPSEAPPAQVPGGAEKIQVGLVTSLLAVLLAARNNV